MIVTRTKGEKSCLSPGQIGARKFGGEVRQRGGGKSSPPKWPQIPRQIWRIGRKSLLWRLRFAEGHFVPPKVTRPSESNTWVKLDPSQGSGGNFQGRKLQFLCQEDDLQEARQKNSTTEGGKRSLQGDLDSKTHTNNSRTA